jgi:hypothetical protein
MNCYARTRTRLARVVNRVFRRVCALPPPLRQLGMEWWRALGPKPQHYFSSEDSPPLLYLPVWLAEGVAVADGPAAGRRLDAILEATALLYFHTRIQDDVLDEPLTRGRSAHLLLGNVLEWQGWAILRELPLSDGFWAHAATAWQVFSSETAAERAQVHSRGPYPAARFRRHARKVALARIPLHAVQDLVGRPAPARVNLFVDRLGEAYGLVNDVLGVERDLKAGLRTYLIASVAQGLPVRERPTPARLRRALLERPHLESFLDEAIRLHQRVVPMGEALGIRCMAGFTADRIARLRHHQTRALGLRLGYALARKA